MNPSGFKSFGQGLHGTSYRRRIDVEFIEMKSFIPHNVLLLSLFVGGIQGGIFANLVERHFQFSGVRELANFLGCFVVGIILGFLEIDTLRKLGKRK